MNVHRLITQHSRALHLGRLVQADKNGETFDLQDDEGMTALHWACVMENDGVARLLEAAGADASLVDKGGKKAADWRGEAETEEVGGMATEEAMVAAAVVADNVLSKEGTIFREQLAEPLRLALEAVLERVEKAGEMTEGEAIRAIAEHLMRNNRRAQENGVGGVGVGGGDGSRDNVGSDDSGLSAVAKAAGMAVKELV